MVVVEARDLLRQPTSFQAPEDLEALLTNQLPSCHLGASMDGICV